MAPIPKMAELLQENKELREANAQLREQLGQVMTQGEANELREQNDALVCKIERLNYELKRLKTNADRDKRVAYKRGFEEGKGR